MRWILRWWWYRAPLAVATAVLRAADGRRAPMLDARMARRELAMNRGGWR